uniref:Uncharacterized protein n=1 Tax=Amphimedon queenslandica TaxID=400682 RepID=A0A1X7V7R1_AMPQE
MMSLIEHEHHRPFLAQRCYVHKTGTKINYSLHCY